MKVRREIDKEQEHESEAHALLTAGSDGLAEVVERVKNKKFCWCLGTITIKY